MTRNERKPRCTGGGGHRPCLLPAKHTVNAKRKATNANDGVTTHLCEHHYQDLIRTNDTMAQALVSAGLVSAG